MTAQPTAWDRAHAKSCWARGTVGPDVVEHMYPTLDGVFATFRDAGFRYTSDVPRPPKPRKFSLEQTYVALLRKWPDGTLVQRGRYAGDGAWLPAESDTWWHWQFRDREARAMGFAPDRDRTAEEATRQADFMRRFRETLERRAANAKRR